MSHSRNQKMYSRFDIAQIRAFTRKAIGLKTKKRPTGSVGNLIKANRLRLNAGTSFNRDLLLRQSFLTGGFGAAFVFMASIVPALAGPQGATVKAGAVSISGINSPSVIIKQSTNKAIIDWQTYSVGVSESVTYQQPNAGSISLNRVTGGDPSAILGDLSANGQVWLVNPAGVIFGSSAKIDVAGLVATTSNITDDNFLSGNYNFDTATTQRGAVVVNQGDITVADGGLLAFVAPGVANNGTITATFGKVALASGDAFSFDFYGDELINLTVSNEEIGTLRQADGQTLSARIVQGGSIFADGGTVQLTVQDARSLIDNSINMSGYIRANTISNEGGSIVLGGGSSGIVTVTGSIESKGLEENSIGGTVKVLGDKVGLLEGARIDVSGTDGGGEVLVGGNYLGLGPEQNATATYIDALATINADSLERGDGGRVIVWSDNYTLFNGSISASGGLFSGNGGFVETSSKNVLVATGTVIASANAGAAGLWLLDPYNVAVTATADNNIINGPLFEPSGGSSVVTVATLLTSLDAGVAVSISTNTAGGAESGNVQFQAPINHTGAVSTLTVNAAGNIDFTSAADVSSSNGLNLTLNSNIADTGSGVIIFRSDIDLAGGTLNVNSGPRGFSITQEASSQYIRAGAASFTTVSSDIILADTDNDFTSVFATTNGGSNTITIADRNSLTINGLTASTINLTASDITVSSVVSASTAFTITTGGVVGLGAHASGGLDLSNAELDFIDTAHLRIDASGDIDAAGVTLAATADIDKLTLDSNGNDVSFITSNSFITGDLVVDTVTTTISNNIQVGGDLTITNTGTATISADITAAGDVSFDSSGGISLSSDISTGGFFAVNASVVTLQNDVTIDAVTSITLDEVLDGTNDTNILTLAAGTSIAIDDNVGAGGAILRGLDIKSGGAVTFDTAAASLAIGGNGLNIGSVSVVTSVKFDGQVDVDGHIDINTGTLDLNGQMSTTSGGNITVSNSSTADIGGVLTANSHVTFDGSGEIVQGRDITATLGTVTITDSVLRLRDNRSIIAGLNITLDEIAADLNDTRELTLTAGGNILIDDVVGTRDSNSIRRINITDAADVRFANVVTVGGGGISIGSNTPVTNDVEFDGIVTSSAAVDINTNTFTLDAALNGSSTVTITNTGLADLNAAITATGAINFDDATTGTIELGGNLRSTSASVSVSDATLTVIGADHTIQAATSITLDEINDDVISSVLTLTAGGAVTIDDNVGVNGGTVLGGLDITGGAAVDFSNAAATIDIGAGELKIGSAGAVTSVTFGGAINVASNSTISADEGVTVGATFTQSAGTLTLNVDADANDNTGTLTITQAISNAGRTIDLTVNDLAISGAGSITAATLNVQDSDGTGIGLGSTALAGGVNITGAELQAIFVSGTATLTSTGNVTVDSITAANSNNAAVVNIDAGGSITVSGASTFNSLSFAADDGINISAALISDTGNVVLDGDGDDAVDGSDDLDIRADVTSAGDLTLEATSGGIALNANLSAAGDIGVDSAVITITGGDRSITSSGAGITLDEVVSDGDDTRVLTLSAATGAGGTIVIDDNLGAVGARLNRVVVTQANDVHFSSADATISVGTGGLAIGSGTSITGDVEFDAAAAIAGDITVSSSTYTQDSTLTITGAGTTTITNSGTATIGGDISSAGSLTFNGAGGITLSANLTSTGGAISVADSAITLTGDLAITTTNQAITLDEILTDTDNDHILTLTAGNGTILINDNVGVSGGNVLGGLRITTTGIVNFDTANATIDIGDQQFLFNASAASVAFDGDVSANSSVTVNANDGITVSGTITLGSGALTLNADQDANDNLGTLTLVQTVNNLGRNINLDANDINISANVIAGDLNIEDSDGTGVALGTATVVNGISLSGAELRRLLVSGTATITTAGDVTVTNVTEANSDNITSLNIQSLGSVSFTGTASTFNDLNIDADDGVSIQVDLTADVASITIDGDADDTDNAGLDNINFSSGVMLSAASNVDLRATTGGISFAGSGTISGGNGILLRSGTTAGGSVTFDADSDDNGSGTFDNRGTLNAAGQTIVVTANDVALSNNVTGSIITIVDSDGTGIGLGDTGVGLNLSGAELQLLSGILVLQTAGSVTVDNITGANSQNVSAVTIDAVGAVTFSGADSTFNSATIQSDSSISIGAGLTVTTDVGGLSFDADANNAGGDGAGRLDLATGVTLSSAGALTLDASSGGVVFAGTGTLNAVSGVTLNDEVSAIAGTLTIDADTDNAGGGTFVNNAQITATGQSVSITADNVTFADDITANTISIVDSDGSGIGIGATSLGLSISAAELQMLRSVGTTTFTTGGAMTVDGISAVNSNNIASVVLVAGADVTFANTASTFNELTVRSDTGINVNVDVSSDVGALAFDGNVDNDVGAGNDIVIASGVTISASSGITLDATTGGITFQGSGTLNAGNGLTVNDAVTSTAGDLVIDVDSDNNGSGIFTNSASINASGRTLSITADDFVIGVGGSIVAATLNLADSDGSGFGLGNTAVGADLSVAEISELTSTGNTNFITAGDVTIDNISAASTDNIATFAVDAVGTVNFSNNTSVFDGAVSIASDTDINVNVDVSTVTVGSAAISFDGDSDNAGGLGSGRITIANNVTIASANSITLDSTTGGIRFAGAGALDAVASVTLNDATTVLGTVSINADTNANQVGTFTNNASINAAGQILNITAGDVVVSGDISAATVTITSTGDIDIGDATSGGELRIDRAELNRVTATNLLEFATSGSNDIYIDNVQNADSNQISHVVIDSSDNVIFSGSDALFQRLTVENGDLTVIDAVSIYTEGGAISFTGNVEVRSSAVTIGNGGGASSGGIVFNNDVILDAADAGQDLTIVAGLGNVTFSGLVNINSSDLVISSGAVVSLSNGGGDAITGSTGSIDITTSIRTDLDDNISLSGAGNIEFDSVTISDALISTVGGDVTFGGSVNLDVGGSAVTTGAGAGTITFSSTLDGAQTLDLTAGAGDIDFDGAVGDTTPLGAVTITSAANVTADSTFEAASYRNSVTGTSLFSDTVTTTGSFVFTGNNLTLNGSGNSIGTSMTVTNTGSFTTGDNADLTVGTEFVQNGAGNSIIGDDLTSTTDGFAFATNVTLVSTDAITIQTGEGADDDLVVTGTLSGTDDNLTIDAGELGDITLTGAVDLGTGSLTITDGDIASFGSTVDAASFTQNDGTTFTTFSGAVTTDGSFAFTGNALTLNGSDNSIGTSMTVTNAGTFTTGDDANLTVSAEFVQNGAGNSVIGDDLTSTNDGFAFATNVTLTSSDAITIQTGEGADDDLVVTGTLSGIDDNLTIDAGSEGDITFTGALDLGTGILAIRDSHIFNAGLVNADTIVLNAEDVATGNIRAAGDATINADVVRAITVVASNALIEANGRIDRASVVSDTLTVRGNEGVVLINSTVAGASAGEAFRHVRLLEPYRTGTSLYPFGSIRYTVNGMPFGPEREGILSIVNQNTRIAFGGSFNAAVSITANYPTTELDKIFNTDIRYVPYQFSALDSQDELFEFVIDR